MAFNDNTSNDLQRKVEKVADDLETLTISLKSQYMRGRIRTDRTAPINSSDVQTPDKIYDVVYTATDMYVLINNSGTLAWRNISLGVF